MTGLVGATAITLRQPYASLVAYGVKRIETRSWSTEFRGSLLIHAGVSMGLDPVGGWRVVIDGRVPTIVHEDGEVLDCLLGAHVASVRLADVVPASDVLVTADLTDQLPLGNFGPGQFAWLLDSLQRFDEPVHERGRQGLWRSRVIVGLDS